MSTPKEPPLFDDLAYTRRKIKRQLLLMQEHASDGSAFANCRCIQEKHLDLLSSYAAEGLAMTTDSKEKQFYQWLATWADSQIKEIYAVLDKNNDEQELQLWAKLATAARTVREEVKHETWNIPAVHRQIEHAAYSGAYPEISTAGVMFDHRIKDAGISSVDLQTGQVFIHLNAKLEAHPDLAAVVIDHELAESACNIQCANKCHLKAQHREPAGARHAIERLIA